MNDFTTMIDEIKAAYLTHGLRPIKEHFFVADQGGDLACPLVALAIHRGVADRSDPELARDDGFNLALEWAAEQFGEAFALGFMDGFDGKPPGGNPPYLSGHGMGVLAAEQLVVGG